MTGPRDEPRHCGGGLPRRRRRRSRARSAVRTRRTRAQTCARDTTRSWTAAATAWDGAMMRSSRRPWANNMLGGARDSAPLAQRGRTRRLRNHRGCRVGAMPTAAKRRNDAEGPRAVPAAARRSDHERRRAATVDGFHQLTRVVSPRSAWRPSPLATTRCARACGDIRSGVTGSLRDGVAEPARRGRAAAGGASSVMGLVMADVRVREGARRQLADGAAGQAARCVRGSGFRCDRMGGSQREVEVARCEMVQRSCRAGGGRGVVQHDAWCRFGAGLDGMLTGAEEGAALHCVSLVGFGG